VYQALADAPLDEHELAVIVEVTSLGVTHWPRLGPGVGTTGLESQVGIALDVDKIVRVSRSIGVEAESLAVAVLVHELAHMLRRHVDDTSGPHSRLAESDAQNDAWAALTTLLSNDRYASVARNAAASIVKLSDLQPSAYQTFGAHDVARYAQSPTEPTTWAVGVNTLAAHDLVVGPLLELLGDERFDEWRCGDFVFVMGDNRATAGPFTNRCGWRNLSDRERLCPRCPPRRLSGKHRARPGRRLGGYSVPRLRR
jgi:hypothetical protein